MNTHQAFAFGFVAFVILGTIAFWGMALTSALRGASARRLLSRGNPRRFRARIRWLARSGLPPDAEWCALSDAYGLFWEGAFEACLARVAPITTGQRRWKYTVRAIGVEIVALLFVHRIDEARRLFDAHRDDLRVADFPRETGIPLSVVDAMLRFHEGDLAESRAAFEGAQGALGPRRLAGRLVRYHLAAMAHAEGRTDDARGLLAATAEGGGSLFIAAWAADTHAELFPSMPALQSSHALPGAGPPRGAVAWALRTGLRSLFLRRSTEKPAVVAYGDVALLLALDVACAALLGLSDYRRGALFLHEQALAVVAPIALFTVTAYAAMALAGRPQAAPRLAAAFYGAVPALLLLDFAVGRLDRDATGGVTPLGLLLALWSLAVFITLVRRLAPKASIARLAGAALVFFAMWSAPQRWAEPRRMWFKEAPGAATSWETRMHELAKFDFAQADALRASEAALLSGRPDVPDLYFVGFAGSDAQDVFLHEVSSAQRLFDERFDTRGRSMLLANGVAAAATLPAATTVTLEHALMAVGQRMNREEDVLFLLLTSHGSKRGLDLRSSAWPAAMDDDDLSPEELRAALDAAGIRWRVLVISACHAGVFVEPLRNASTLIATAADADRASFGCEDGQEFTEFGRAVFADALPLERHFAVAFAMARTIVKAREEKRHLEPSRPQLDVGADIATRLCALETRLNKLAPASAP